MKQKLSLLTIFALIITLCGISSADDKREEKPRFKGVELYSWKDKAGDWVFVLLNGTNALKKEEQVKEAKGQIKGSDELKKALALLAVGEQVAWTHHIKGFELPPEATRKEIKKTAKELKIVLRIAGDDEE